MSISKRKSVKERKEDERQCILNMAKQACSGPDVKVSSTGTIISDGTSYMLKNGKYYVLSMEPANRFQSRMKWKEI